MSLLDPNVATPKHYSLGIPTIDIIRSKLSKEEFTGFCKGNIIKYITRAGHKRNENPLDDYLKSQEYTKYLIEHQ